jgi:L-asparaginase
MSIPSTLIPDAFPVLKTASKTLSVAVRGLDGYYIRMKLRLIIAGGTIDKQFNQVTGDLAFGDTHLNEMLAQARFEGELTIEHILMKDSLDMTQEDRDKLAEACLDASEERIIVTHGLDTMIESSQTIAKALLGKAKTVILTGAMVPYSFGMTSDALFNLGTALAYAQSLSEGVYVAMNGHFFASDNIARDTTTGLFHERIII